jgi:hypothetical protein
VAELTCNQLAQYRGCLPGNDCYDTCQLAAQRVLDNPVAAADQDELRDAARWAATITWLPLLPGREVRGAEWPT